MEFLKKSTWMIVLMLVANAAFSQVSQDVLQAAFTKSYTSEKNGDFTAALDPLKKVYDESSYELNLRLGWLNYNAGLFDEAIIFYGRAQKLKPYSEEARFGLILPLAALGKWNDVIKIYDAILETSPNNSVALYRLGLIYYGRKDYNKANTLFKKVVDLYPFGYDGLLMLGWTSYFLGNTSQAKVLFNKVNLYNPGDKSANEGLNLIK
ncbi:MAG: tetratricopeptide repeat protein [Prolixibacteraceae bacterium]|nr:tetratricopeptide repeat protein [Prolixibacteraceae bacterium]